LAGSLVSERRGSDGHCVDTMQTGPALEDIIAGRVSMMFADFTSAMPQVTAGTIRPLAINANPHGDILRYRRPLNLATAVPLKRG
jgi:tripartite-type tricarboxylate transporter receptor subunit TctC